MIVEIPYNSFIKYEFDKESAGQLRCDRILHTAMAYPGNYGFFPNTLAGDGDPLDVLLICDYALYPGTIIKVKIIGVLLTEDEKGQDEKIIAVPVTEIDPSYKQINTITDVPLHQLTKIKHFFSHYKDIEINKWIKVKGYKEKTEAEAIYKKSLIKIEKVA